MHARYNNPYKQYIAQHMHCYAANAASCCAAYTTTAARQTELQLRASATAVPTHMRFTWASPWGCLPPRAFACDRPEPWWQQRRWWRRRQIGRGYSWGRCRALRRQSPFPKRSSQSTLKHKKDFSLLMSVCCTVYAHYHLCSYISYMLPTHFAQRQAVCVWNFEFFWSSSTLKKFSRISSLLIFLPTTSPVYRDTEVAKNCNFLAFRIFL